MATANAAFDNILQTMSAIGSLLLQGETNYLPLRQKLASDWNVASSRLEDIISYVVTLTTCAVLWHLLSL